MAKTKSEELSDEIKDEIANILDGATESLINIPFRSKSEIKDAIAVLAEAIEGIDATEIFENLAVNPDDYLQEEEE